METLTLTPANYRLEISQDDYSCDTPVYEPFLGNAEDLRKGYAGSPVEIETLAQYGGLIPYVSSRLDSIITKALEGDRALRVKLVNEYDMQEDFELGEDCIFSIFANNYHQPNKWSTVNESEDFYGDCLESAKAQGLIADYAIDQQSYDRSYGALMACIVFDEGYGSAQSWLDEHRNWASGYCYHVALVCDMVDAEGNAKYTECLESTGGIICDCCEIENLAPGIASDYFDSPDSYADDAEACSWEDMPIVFA